MIKCAGTFPGSQGLAEFIRRTNATVAYDVFVSKLLDEPVDQPSSHTEYATSPFLISAQ